VLAKNRPLKNRLRPNHGLLIRALRKHCQEAWILLYVERWLKAPMQTTEGEALERD